MHKLNINKDLDNITDLHNYSDLFLSEIFYSTDPNQLITFFLKNEFLFNFFKNLLKLYPSPELLLLDFSIEEKKEILNFFEDVKKNSFKIFSENRIKKQTFYKLIYYINKNIFCYELI
jgi:hypothetical protein